MEIDSRIISQLEESKFIYAYCEIKTSDYDISKLFTPGRIKYIKKRFGLTEQTNKTNNNGCHLKKILISNKKKDGLPSDIIHIQLNEVVSFIKDRFRSYDEIKYSSRMFFKSSLIQFLIHEANLSLDDK